MIQRINSLGRRRIPRSAVVIEVHDGTPRTFSAKFALHDLKYPSDAQVVLEVMSAGSSTVQRIPCGTIGQLEAPTHAALGQLRGQNVFFTLKVVDRSEQIGRLLGVAENIRPEKTGDETVSGRRGILPVERLPLGQQLWRLEFREHDVFLLVNSEAPGLSEYVGSDPVYYSLIYPAVIRQILVQAIRGGGDPDADDDTWSTLWLCFGRKLHPTQQKPPRHDEEEEIEEWVNEVVTAFCDQHTLRDHFVQSGHGHEDQE